MPAKLDRCVKKVMDQGVDESRAYAICNASINDEAIEMTDKEKSIINTLKDECSKTVSFNDKTTISDGKVISIRDGVMDYYGHEIGMEPLNKIFKIYRSPEEVERIAPMIDGLPVTNGHVDPEGEIDDEIIQGKVNGYSVIKIDDNELNSTIGVEHDVDLSENMLKYIQTKKPESSLGYTGKLIPHEKFDFEQVGLNPHHLAVVPAGRCGKICKFKDENMNQFMNEDGTLNLEAFLEALGEVYDKADDEQKMAIYKAIEPNEEPTANEMQDQDAEPMDKEKKDESFMDQAAIVSDAIAKFKDSTAFLDAVGAAADERAEVIAKARPFLDSKYDFKGKSNQVIMADTLAAEYKDRKFVDNEVNVAFKMLDIKPDESLKNFGDQKPSKWAEAKNKEL